MRKVIHIKPVCLVCGNTACRGVWLVEKDEAKILHHLGGSTYCVPKGRFDV